MSEPQVLSPIRPAFAISAPSGWRVKQSTTVLEPSGRANVIASVEMISADVSASEYARVQGALLHDEFPGYREHGELQAIAVDGVEQQGWYRDFSWLPPDGSPVRQSQLYCVVPGIGFTVTATVTEEQWGELRESLAVIVGSFLVLPT